MTLRNVALIKDGSVTNVVVVEDDPAQLPGYVRACLAAGTPDFLTAAAEEHDSVVELHDGEMCECGMLVKAAAIKGRRGVVRVAEVSRTTPPAVARFERTLVEAQVIE